MTNLEKYFDEIKKNCWQKDLCVSVLNVKNEKCDIENTKCEYCKKNIIKWLLEYKIEIKLTNEEKIILENINKHFKYISRDKNDNLYCYVKKPRKKVLIWDNNGSDFSNFSIFNHLFQFVKWENKEPYLIEDILKNYEVIEDD